MKLEMKLLLSERRLSSVLGLKAVAVVSPPTVRFPTVRCKEEELSILALFFF